MEVLGCPAPPLLGAESRVLAGRWADGTGDTYFGGSATRPVTLCYIAYSHAATLPSGVPEARPPSSALPSSTQQSLSLLSEALLLWKSANCPSSLFPLLVPSGLSTSLSSFGLSHPPGGEGGTEGLILAENRQVDAGLRKGPGFTERSGFKACLCYHWLRDLGQVI